MASNEEAAGCLGCLGLIAIIFIISVIYTISTSCESTTDYCKDGTGEPGSAQEQRDFERCLDNY